MISALQKVSGHAHLDAPEEVRGLFLENREEGLFGLFATHPPIEARIDALVQFAGGRVLEVKLAPETPPPPPVAEPPQAPGPWGEPPPKGPWG